MRLAGTYLILIISLLSCSVDPEIIPSLSEEEVKEIVPPGWPQPNYNFSNNTLSRDGFILGRALFYEPMLSADNTISCGSCHQQNVAFVHAGHALSHGINGLLGTRNAPPLQNLNWSSSFMWDGGVLHLENQPLAPITNPVEMNETIANILAKLRASSKYRSLFAKAFGDDSITTHRFLKALAQFQGLLYSYNSKYDMHYRGEAGGSFNSSQQNGYNLFKQKCASCHTEPLFTDFSFRSNGLPENVFLKDSGRMHITGDPADRFRFKVPSLRNIALTAPYMHDGRFQSLDEVLDHYDHGITNLVNLDPLLSNGIQLTPQERNDLKNFLFTLTDYEFINDPKFKDPN